MDYDNRFFDWINETGFASARSAVPHLLTLGRFDTVLDVGCGQGAWIAVWRENGAHDVLGIDGDYVDRDRLLVPADAFRPVDLSGAWEIGRRFDLVQSLEVAEHLPPAQASAFVETLCRHGDVVVFSAAQPGQGGHNHVNERPPSYWAGLFDAHGYRAYDCVRPALANDTQIAPWYRYNTIVYANATGSERLGAPALRSLVSDVGRLDIRGDLVWEVRKLVLRMLPAPLVTSLSRARYRAAMVASRMRRAS